MSGRSSKDMGETSLSELQQLLLYAQFGADVDVAAAVSHAGRDGFVTLVNPDGKMLFAPDLGPWHVQN